MGWYYTLGASRKAIIEEVTKEQARPQGGYFKTLRKCTSGNTLWTIHESLARNPDTGNLETVKWIGCYLLSRGTGDGWGYKPMDESMGPYYYSCPLSYLAEVPVLNGSWRDGVRSYWDRRREKAATRRQRKASGTSWYL